MLAHQCVTCRWCVAVISSALCAICGDRVAEISSPRVFTPCPQQRSSLLTVVSSPAHQYAPQECTAVHGPSSGTIPNTTGPCSTVHCRPPWSCSATELWLARTLYQAFLRRGLPRSYAWGPRTLPGLPSLRPAWELRLWYAAAFCALRHLWRARSALNAPSILRCQGTPRPVAPGPTPLPKGTTSKGGGRCPGEPHVRSHASPMHIGEDVQEPTPLPTSHGQCPKQASALLHPHYCRHPCRCGCSGLGAMYRSNKNS